MVFGKKKKKDEDTLVRSGVQQADVTPVKQRDAAEQELDPKLTDEQEALMAMVKELKKEYGGYFTPNDAANNGLAVIHSETVTLLVAIYGELKKLNMTLEAIQENSE